MLARKSLFRGFYAALIVSAFVGGRLSVNKVETGDNPEALPPPSLLISQTTAKALPASHNKLLVERSSSSGDSTSQMDDHFREKLAEMVGAGSMDQTAFSQVLEAWVEKDPIGAIDFLAQGKSRNDMLRWIVGLWSKKHPEESSRWLADNREMAGFDHAVEGLTQAIEKDQPEGALEWAQMIEDPAVRARVWVSSGFQKFRQDRELAVAALADSGLPAEAQLAVQESWMKAVESRAKRNSQNLSSVAAAARAAGATFEASSVEDYMAQIIKGVVLESGAFEGEFFGVPNLDELDAAEAQKYLVPSEGVLAYNPQGIGEE